MFDRFKNVMKGMLNQGVSKLETPAILAEQAQMELESGLKKVKEAVTVAVTNEKMLETQLQKNKDDLALWEKRAIMAVEQNNDDLARQCIAKKKEFSEHVQSLTTQLTEQKNSTTAMKQKLSEMEEEYRDFKVKKQAMLARAKAADGVAKANELISGGSGGAGGSSMDKWEEKIRDKENRNEALKEMSGASTEKHFSDAAKSLDLDDELAALKAKMTTPKLIEDKTPTDSKNDGKTIVDANVPMIRKNQPETELEVIDAEVVDETK
ncbi:MAG: PspA/IM30 family protein [Candidatus Obscuribacterales bacterium]|jgi:phage shock protein A